MAADFDATRMLMDDDMRPTTHWDCVKAGAICHEQCAIAEIERLRAELASFKQPVPMSEWQKLVAERDALKADAERYRWLRGNGAIIERWPPIPVQHCLYGIGLDAAIDAARGKK